MVGVKHTPGPWRLQQTKHSPARVLSPSGECLALVYLTEEGSRKQDDEHRANAYLMTTAPDLLTALHAVEKDPGVASLSIPTLRLIVAALDKALGVAE